MANACLQSGAMRQQSGSVPILLFSAVLVGSATLLLSAPAKAADATCKAGGEQISVLLKGDTVPYVLCVTDPVLSSAIPTTPWLDNNKLAHQLADAITGNTAIGQVTNPTTGFSVATSTQNKTDWGALLNQNTNSALFLVKDKNNGTFGAVSYNPVGKPGTNYSVNNGPTPDPTQNYSFVLFLSGPGPDPAPAPLPILGAAAAFSWSRRLRRRTRQRDQFLQLALAS